MNKWEVLNKLYVNQGLQIFPVVSNAKTPLIKEWQNDCSSNYMQLLYWLSNAKDCNWGLPCYENNLFVLDLDVHDESKNGVENFYKLVLDLGIDLDVFDTLTQETPSKGIHLIFKSDDELSQVNASANAFPDYPGIDTRNRHYIVVEPSAINGKEYKFTNNLEPREMPKKLKDYILSVSQKRGDTKKTPYEKPKEVLVGSRDDEIFKYVTNLYYKTRLDYDEILTLANYFNNEILEEPFEEKEVEYKVRKAFEKNRPKIIVVNISEDE